MSEFSRHKYFLTRCDGNGLEFQDFIRNHFSLFIFRQFLHQSHSLAINNPISFTQIAHVVMPVSFYIFSGDSSRLPNSYISLLRSTADHIIMDGRARASGIHEDLLHFLMSAAVSYTHLRAHETDSYLVCRLL